MLYVEVLHAKVQVVSIVSEISLTLWKTQGTSRWQCTWTLFNSCGHDTFSWKMWLISSSSVRAFWVAMHWQGQ